MKGVYHSGFSQKKPRVIVIVGPTASGKSALAVRLARRFGGEIISADSRQVYRGLDIATGKITRREMRGVPHHLLDVADPRKQFSVDDFVKRGRKAVRHIAQKGKVPIVAGGTGLYVDALLGKLDFPNVPPEPALRKRLERRSAAELFAMLKRLDPRRAKNIEQQNPRRLTRAIEIARALDRVPRQELPMAIYCHITIGLKPEDGELRRRIRARVAARMRRGMVAEGRLLAKRVGLKRLREFGLEYRLLADYLQDKISKEELVRRIERADWQYSKRQWRWFKRDGSTRWFDTASSPRIAALIKKTLGAERNQRG